MRRCMLLMLPYRLPNMLLHPVEQAFAQNQDAKWFVIKNHQNDRWHVLLYILCFPLFEVSQARCARHRAPQAQAVPSHKQMRFQ